MKRPQDAIHRGNNATAVYSLLRDRVEQVRPLRVDLWSFQLLVLATSAGHKKGRWLAACRCATRQRLLWGQLQTLDACVVSVADSGHSKCCIGG